jgi:hypothetical protein
MPSHKLGNLRQMIGLLVGALDKSTGLTMIGLAYQKLMFFMDKKASICQAEYSNSLHILM